jgi:tetratricopeptide (TPR) repeat protein
MEYNICDEYIHIIRSKIKNGEYRNAIVSANKVIDYSPELAIAYYLRGICYYALGDYINSISDYGYATAFDEQFAKAFFNMGVAKYKIKQYDAALEDIGHARKIFEEKNDQMSVRKCLESIDIINQERA